MNNLSTSEMRLFKLANPTINDEEHSSSKPRLVSKNIPANFHLRFCFIEVCFSRCLFSQTITP